MNVRWRVVGVALLVALAGCGAVSTGDSAPAETTAETTVEGGSGDEQAVDGFDLAEAHRDALANESFTVTSTETVQYANGTAALRQFVRTHADPAAGAVLSRQVVDGSDPGRFGVPFTGVMELWMTESANVQRLTYENGTTQTHEGFREDVPVVEQATRWEQIATLLVDSDAQSVDVESSDTLVGTDADGADLGYGEPSDVTVTARLSDGEYLRSYTVSYETTRDGTPVQVTRTVRFTNVGETSVERPAWVSDAQNSSS